MSTTTDQIERIELAIANSLETGLNSVTVDGTTTSFVDAQKRIDALRSLKDLAGENKAADLASFGLRHSKLVPPGAG
ncbi:unnamed protein product [marine sediment metagenome]|uniref:Uncharacterized protein n=1 Tax=marine sediment metagenome TaxID=412755 RepID=X1BWP8_9ZZZZ